MAAPWEKYQQQASTGPWDKYQGAPEEQSTLQSVLQSAPVQYGAKALDYLGGLGRTSAAGLAGMVNPNILKPEDVPNALKGQAPTTSEYLTRAGVPRGKSLSEVAPALYSEPGSGGLTNFQLPEKGGPLDPTARGAMGFVGDVALDPLTYLSGGASAAGKAADASKLAKVADVVANPIGSALEKGGETMYASGIKNVNRAVGKYGKDPLTDTLMNAGVWGGPQAISKGSEDLITQLAQRKEQLAKLADAKGGVVDMNASLKRALGIARDMQADPATKAIGETMMDHLGQYSAMAGPTGQIPVSQASDWKKSLNNALGSETFNIAKQTKPGQKVLKTFQQDLDRGIEEGANAVSPVEKYGSHMSAADDAMAPLLQARPQMQSEIQKSVTKNAVTPVDVMMGGAALAATHDPYKAAAWVAAKKAADLTKTPTFRTGTGLLMNRAGGTGIIDPALRQGVWKHLYDQSGNQK